MVATWDDSDEKDLQEVSNLALMAIRDDKLDEINIPPTYDELYDVLKNYMMN